MQMVLPGETVTAGNGFTVTVACAVAVQPLRSPVTVYVVVDNGDAITLAPVDELSVEDGLQA